VLQEFGGDFGNLDEAGSTVLEFGDEIDGVIDGVDGIVEDDGTSVIGLGISFSGIIDETNVVGNGGQNVVSGGKGSFSLSFEDVGGFKDSVGRFEGVGGILNFVLSVADFAITFGLLSSIDLVVGVLFVRDGSFELVKYSLDGIEGWSGFDLVFNFHHDVHDASFTTILDGVFLHETCISDG